jgi:ACS family glucarate transporter-like MFS transporter
MTTAPVEFRESQSIPPDLRPTTVHWRIMAMVTVVNMLPALGKVSLGVTGKLIQDEFQIGDTTMGWILGAFVVGFALCQVPGGWAGDRYGPRKVLMAAILWYSFFLAAMAVVPYFAKNTWLGLALLFAAIRFLIGAGESLTASNSAKVVGSWMSAGNRGIGVSFYSLGVGAGGALTPFAIVWTMQRWGWRTSFVLCGLLGVIIAFAWGLYVTDRPEDHPHVNAAELALLRGGSAFNPRKTERHSTSVPTPWRRILSDRSVWSLILSFMCRAYAIYFFDTWFFIYLLRARGLTIRLGGFWGGAPYLAILLLSPAGGWVSDFAVRKLGKRRGRQTAVWIGMACSTVLILVGANTSNNYVAISMVAAGAGFNMFASVTWWATCIDIAPSHAASLSALMNTCGALGGWLAPVLTAYLAESFGWSRALDFVAFLSLLAGMLWFFVKADQGIEKNSVGAPTVHT